MKIFLCKSQFDGILSGVFDVYASKIDISECRLEMEDEYEPVLFAEYQTVEMEAWKAERVAKKIKSFMSEAAYMHLYRASLHNSPERADWILRFIALGLKNGRRVIKMLQEPAVYEVFQMDRYVGREAHFWIEFARFEPLKNGVYYCKVGAVNRVIELVADHFSDRFPDMDWIIYDEKHAEAAFHSRLGTWIVHRGIMEEELNKVMERSEQDVYVDLWKTFFHTIAIEERTNYKCQRTMLPIRYRKYITEFQ